MRSSSSKSWRVLRTTLFLGALLAQLFVGGTSGQDAPKSPRATFHYDQEAVARFLQDNQGNEGPDFPLNTEIVNQLLSGVVFTVDTNFIDDSSFTQVS